jgi:RNA polymerase sigma factor (sigma-70 family)
MMIALMIPGIILSRYANRAMTQKRQKNTAASETIPKLNYQLEDLMSVVKSVGVKYVGFDPESIAEGYLILSQMLHDDPHCLQTEEELNQLKDHLEKTFNRRYRQIRSDNARTVTFHDNILFISQIDQGVPYYECKVGMLRLIDKLKDDDRELLVAKYVEEKTLDQLAEQFALSKYMITQHLNRLISTLRALHETRQGENNA